MKKFIFSLFLLGIILPFNLTGQSASLTNISNFDELNLDDASFTYEVANDTITDSLTLATSDFSLINAPSGLGIESVDNMSTFAVTLSLQFDREDFDSDVTDFKVRLDAAKLKISSSGLESSSATITAYDESANISPDVALNENNLNTNFVTLTLTDESFVDHSNLSSADFTLRNVPGLSIESITNTSTTSARINLDYDGTDFDSDITNFYIEIRQEALVQSTATLSTNQLTVTAVVEPSSATATPDQPLEEFTLDGRTLTIQLFEDSFVDHTQLQSSDFELLGEPGGLSVGSLGTTTSTSAVLNLSFDGTDFDNDRSNFRVGIRHEELVNKSGSDLETSPSLFIDARVEPNITDVDIPNTPMKVGDMVNVTITVNNDQGDVYTLQSGTIGGFTVENLQRESPVEYSASFEVTEGGNDYASWQSIPVSLRLKLGSVNGNLYTGPISQSNDPIDANSPGTANDLTVQSGGTKHIGSGITYYASFSDADKELDLSLTNDSEIGGVPSNRFSVNGLSGGSTYVLSYTVNEGDQDVAMGALTGSLKFKDEAGNTGPAFTAINIPNLAIDANPPHINNVVVSSTDQILAIGDSVVMTITATETGLTVDDDTRVNNVFVTEDNVRFSEIGGNQYRLSYTVEAGDQNVSRGNLQIRVILIDPAGNKNSAYTNLASNDVSISTNIPAVTLSLNTNEICRGDSVKLIFSPSSGQEPYEIDYFDGSNTYTLSNIPESGKEIWVRPLVDTDYRITRVTDLTENVNTTPGTIRDLTVKDLPDVNITGLLSTYSNDSATIPLNGKGTPIGGSFSGPGVIEPENDVYLFRPDIAGVENSPHDIVYTVTENGCTNKAVKTVNVIIALAEIEFERDVACYYEDGFMVTGSNQVNQPGTLSISPSVPGGFQMINTDTALINPAAYNLDRTEFFEVTYSYIDTSGAPFSITENIEVEYLDPPVIINPLDDTELCNNVPPFAINGNYPNQAVFSGPGVTGDGVGGFKFDPALAPVGNVSLKYTITTGNHCHMEDSVNLNILESPVVDFKILDTCLAVEETEVHFENNTITEGLNITWDWYFDDINSGAQNISSLFEPTHTYTGLGRRNIRLIATTGENCIDTLEVSHDFFEKPNADFTWSTECFGPDSIVFRDLTQVNSKKDYYTWNFFDENQSLIKTVEGGPDKDTVKFKWSSRNSYDIEMIVRTETRTACYDTVTKTLPLRPTLKLSAGNYFEDFEGRAEGWFSEAGLVEIEDEVTESSVSWTLENVASSKFPYDASSGSKAYFTEVQDRTLPELSYISSPCFNFQGLVRPMVKFDIKRSMERDVDGAVLQYSLDNGFTWNRIGRMGDGSNNWYNSVRIDGNPGGQSEGWTGDNIFFTEDTTWLEASHELDDLIGQQKVRMRIGYGSEGNLYGKNDGIAIDNFWIGKRTRLVLLEHFTNANSPDARPADSLLDFIVATNKQDVIDIQYHTDFPSEDVMSEQNRVPGASKALYYSISKVPYTVMDGGLDDAGKRSREYDYDLSDLDSLDLFSRVLIDPGFKISVEGSLNGNTLTAVIRLEALRDFSKRKMFLNVAVVEKLLTGEEYAGDNGDLWFKNVVRKMLPDIGATNFNRAWSKGEVETLTLTWKEFYNFIQPDNWFLVAFLQDGGNRNVYQTATNDPDYITSSVPEYMERKGLKLLVYPNPAWEKLNVVLDKARDEPIRIEVYNYAGSQVMNLEVEPGITFTQLDVSSLPDGFYILRAVGKNRVLGQERVIIY